MGIISKVIKYTFIATGISAAVTGAAVWIYTSDMRKSLRESGHYEDEYCVANKKTFADGGWIVDFKKKNRID